MDAMYPMLPPPKTHVPVFRGGAVPPGPPKTHRVMEMHTLTPYSLFGLNSSQKGGHNPSSRGEPHSTSVVATGELELLIVPKDSFHFLLDARFGLPKDAVKSLFGPKYVASLFSLFALN